MSKSGFFPAIPIACWSGFGIFNENEGNPDEIGMVGQSDDIKWELLKGCSQNSKQ